MITNVQLTKLPIAQYANAYRVEHESAVNGEFFFQQMSGSLRLWTWESTDDEDRLIDTEYDRAALRHLGCAQILRQSDPEVVADMVAYDLRGLPSRWQIMVDDAPGGRLVVDAGLHDDPALAWAAHMRAVRPGAGRGLEAQVIDYVAYCAEDLGLGTELDPGRIYAASGHRRFALGDLIEWLRLEAEVAGVLREVGAGIGDGDN